MDYLNYGKQVQQKPEGFGQQKPQPPAPVGFLDVKPNASNIDFDQKVGMTIDDFKFGDLNQRKNDLSFNKSFFNEKTNTHQPIQQKIQTKNTDANPILVNSNTGTKHVGLDISTDESGNELIQLFPIPVRISKYPNDYTKELEFIHNSQCIGLGEDDDNQSLKQSKELGVDFKNLHFNRQSVDNFILDNPVMANIRKWIESKIHEYSSSIMGSKSELFITQSWLNKSGKGESHHEHSHPNSLLSGVWYPQIHEKLPPIQFRSSNSRDVSMSVDTFNQFNSSTFMLPMRMGELIIFPSNLVHSVPQNVFDQERISLSFNTWCKGSMGDKNQLTYLPLDRCV